MSSAVQAPQGGSGKIGVGWLFISWLIVTLILWFMAFFSAGDATPEWLVRAQAVCFGTTKTGLPDTYGWFVLILAPLSFLGALFVVYGAEVGRGLGVLSASSIGSGIVSLLFVAVLSEAIWVGGRISKGIELANVSYEFVDENSFPVDYPVLNQEASDFTLIDQYGDEITLSSFKDQPVLITFAFAHCTTVCPVLVRNVMEAMKDLNGEGIRALVISLDPWRDTPGSLPALAKKWNAPEGVHLLSGEVEAVNAVLDAYNVARTRDEKTGDVVHPALVYVVNSNGSLQYALNSPKVSWLVDASRQAATPSPTNVALR
jgi:cytochrome oxidase Cu insertion factor (SCO1/SenC/PrrC family)